MNYSELYDARKIIKGSADNEINDIMSARLFANDIFERKLKGIIYSTADRDRLKVMNIEE